MTGGAGLRRPLRFGERMSGMEALMWRLGGRDARFRATMALVVSLEGRVRRPALEARLAALCRAVPRLTDRVRESHFAAVPPAWEPDTAFSIDHHLDEMTGDVWDVAGRVVAAPFAEGRPPWRVVVVPSGTSRGDAVVLHLHHSYTDGLGGMRLLGELFDVDPEGSGSPAAGSSPAGPGSPASGLEAMLVDLEDEVRRAARVWSRALPWATRTIAAARRDPGAVLHAAGDLATSIQIQIAAAVGPGSLVLADRSPETVLQALCFPLDAVIGAARRLAVTVNDIYLAGLLDGLERYHAKMGSVPPGLRLAIPVSTRQAEAEMRNQLFGVVIRGPLGYLDFDERARLVHEIVVQGRNVPLAGLVDDLADALVRFPGGVSVAASALSSLDVLASNVVGPPVHMWLTGIPIRDMTPFGPRSGSGLNATLLSYAGTAHIGLNVDPAAVVDPPLLRDCLEAAFGENLGV